MTILCSRLTTPIGRLFLAERRDGSVVRIEFARGRGGQRELGALLRGSMPDEEIVWQERRGSRLHRQLERYFAGRLRDFDLDLETVGTPFQQRVWDRLCRIPYGRTSTYAELARAIGQPTAVRAVARANAQNPIPIVVPCHRVIGSDGSLTGYGGGIERKRALLDLERGKVGETGMLPYQGTA